MDKENDHPNKKSRTHVHVKADLKIAVFMHLSKTADHGNRLPRGAVQKTAAKFGLSTKMVKRIWSVSRKVDTNNEHGIIQNLSINNRKGSEKRQIDLEPLNDYEPEDRDTN